MGKFSRGWSYTGTNFVYILHPEFITIQIISRNKVKFRFIMSDPLNLEALMSADPYTTYQPPTRSTPDDEILFAIKELEKLKRNINNKKISHENKKLAAEIKKEAKIKSHSIKISKPMERYQGQLSANKMYTLTKKNIINYPKYIHYTSIYYFLFLIILIPL